MSKAVISQDWEGWTITIDDVVRGRYASAQYLAEHFVLLVQENDKLRADVQHLQNKISHGCTDAICAECDTDNQGDE